MPHHVDEGLRLERAIIAAARRERDWRRIFTGPLEDAIPFLMSFMVPVDSRTGDVFSFEHLREPSPKGEVWLDTDGVTLRCAGWDGPANSRGGHKTWRWQRWIVDRIVATRRRIDLKGRQIGDTWINVGYDVAEALLKPGADSLIYRQKEKDAIKNVQRWWILYQSLPEWIKERVPSGKRIGPVKVIRPDRGDRPGRDGVSLKFADGRVSDVVPMTSAESSGHGESTRKILLDEAAHIDLLADIRAAVEPAAGELGDIGIVSTAHGRSNPDTGRGQRVPPRLDGRSGRLAGVQRRLPSVQPSPRPRRVVVRQRPGGAEPSATQAQRAVSPQVGRGVHALRPHLLRRGGAGLLRRAHGAAAVPLRAGRRLPRRQGAEASRW
jgi:hypothetical protein